LLKFELIDTKKQKLLFQNGSRSTGEYNYPSNQNERKKYKHKVGTLLFQS